MATKDKRSWDNIPTWLLWLLKIVLFLMVASTIKVYKGVKGHGVE